jgi:hypothetical protein
LLFALLLTLFLPLKGGFFLYMFTRFSIRARTSWLASLSLANYSEFSLIVASLAYEQGLIGSEWLIIIALSLSISFVISSPLNIQAHRLFNKYRPQITMLNKKCEHPDDEITDLGDAQYLICGMGRIGRVVYHYLHGKYGDKVIAIDYDMEKVEKLQASNKRVFWGDATDSLFWQMADLSNIKMVFLSMSDHPSNVNVAKEIKSLPQVDFLIGSTSRFRDEFLELKEQGVHFVYNYYDRLGADFAERFVNYSHNKLEEFPIEAE